MDWNSVTAAFSAAEKAAASIYHQVLATGVHIIEWEHDPVTAPLIDVALGIATDMLTRFGVPAATIGVIAADIVYALKFLAALDGTVPSVARVTTVITQSSVGLENGGAS